MKNEKNSTDQSAERKSGTFAETLKREVLFRFLQTRWGGGEENRQQPNDIVLLN